MKSKKIVAMFVALVAIMAVATSGLAATTTYNYQENGYVNVNVKVKADAGKEVTYLVTSGATILYIDQQTADAQSGMVEFEYKIKDSNMPKTYSGIVAKFGTNGTEVVTSDSADATLAFGPVTFNEGNFEPICDDDITKLGTGDTVNVTITPDDNYTITGITINNEPIVNPTPAGHTITVKKGDVVNVTTEAVIKDPVVNVVTPEVFGGGEDAPSSAEERGTIAGVEVAATTAIMQVTGNPFEVGVMYDGKPYKAQNNGTGYADGYYAVRIIINGDIYPVVTPYIQKTENDKKTLVSAQN